MLAAQGTRSRNAIICPSIRGAALLGAAAVDRVALAALPEIATTDKATGERTDECASPGTRVPGCVWALHPTALRSIMRPRTPARHRADARPISIT